MAQPLWEPKEAEEANYYEKMFGFADRDKTGSVTGAQAVKFFMLSTLPVESLQKIWSCANSSGDEFLQMDEFMVAMRLIAIAQDDSSAPLTKQHLWETATDPITMPALKGAPKPSIQISQGKQPPPLPPKPQLKPQAAGKGQTKTKTKTAGKAKKQKSAGKEKKKVKKKTSTNAATAGQRLMDKLLSSSQGSKARAAAGMKDMANKLKLTAREAFLAHTGKATNLKPVEPEPAAVVPVKKTAMSASLATAKRPSNKKAPVVELSPQEQAERALKQAERTLAQGEELARKRAERAKSKGKSRKVRDEERLAARKAEEEETKKGVDRKTVKDLARRNRKTMIQSKNGKEKVKAEGAEAGRPSMKAKGKVRKSSQADGDAEDASRGFGLKIGKATKLSGSMPSFNMQKQGSFAEISASLQKVATDQFTVTALLACPSGARTIHDAMNGSIAGDDVIKAGHVACPTCKKGVPAVHLDQHQASVCRLRSCPLCERMLLPSTLPQHLATSCPSRPWTCSVCNATVPSKLAVKHMKSSCPRMPLQCQGCQEMYESVEGHHCLPPGVAY